MTFFQDKKVFKITYRYEESPWKTLTVAHMLLPISHDRNHSVAFFEESTLYRVMDKSLARPERNVGKAFGSF